jgi:hypothetical protein
MSVSDDAIVWRDSIIPLLTGEFAPIEQCCFPWPNTVSPTGVHCGGISTAISHLSIYSDIVAEITPGCSLANIGGGSGFSSRLFFLYSGGEVLHTDNDLEFLNFSEIFYPCPGVKRVLWDITEPKPQ